MKIIIKIGLAVIKDKKVLLAKSRKNKDIFYTLGGKLEEGETDEECVIREVKEEINVSVKKESLIYLGEVSAASHDKKDTVITVRLYHGEITGKPLPSNEVDEVRYFNSHMSARHRSELCDKVLVLLKQKGLID